MSKKWEAATPFYRIYTLASGKKLPGENDFSTLNIPEFPAAVYPDDVQDSFDLQILTIFY